MASGEATSPLLEGAGWDDIDHIEEQVSEFCNVSQLLKEHPHDVVRYLQAKGVAKLGEFSAPDSLVFPAFERDPLITLGSSSRKIDYEREWREALQQYSKGDKPSGWSTEVEVEAFVLTIRHAADPDKDGLLQPLIKRWQARRCTHSVFALPAVQGVIAWKWNAFARRMLLAELAFFVLWLVAFNTFTIAFQDEDLTLSLGQLLATTRGRVELVAHALALFGMAPFLILEVGTIPAYGLGWFDAWNTLDVCTYVIQVCVTAMHLSRWHLESDWLTVLPAVQCILLVFRLQYYSQAFRPTRFAFLDTIYEVMQDLRWYLFFLLMVMWGFGCAFHVVFRREQEDNEEYDSILHAFLSMFEHQYGDIELKSLWKTKSPIAATTLGVAYTFVMGLVLINLLIGIVLNSLDKAMEHQDMKLQLSKARIIDELESTLPRWLENRNPQWYPPYVHMLRINPNKLDQVEVDALWSHMGEESPPIITQGGGDQGGQAAEEVPPPEASTGGDWERAEDRGQGQGHGRGAAGVGGKDGDGVMVRLDGLQRQLDEQGRLLRRLCGKLGPAERDLEE